VPAASGVIDPAPFLSTIILASAGLVAIIGGLLVARFVSLDSDQQSSRKIIGEARDRLDSAKRRAEGARDSRLRWHAGYFFRGSILKAVAGGVGDAVKLVRIDDDWPFTVQELQPYADQVADEFAQARAALREHERTIDQLDNKNAWDHFRRVTPHLPEIHWERVWEYAFAEIRFRLYQEHEEAERREREQRRRDREKQAVSSPLGLKFPELANLRAQMHVTPDYSQLGLPQTLPTVYSATRARRDDEYRTADERARQQVEDYESELGRLEQDHAEIVRPDARLWWGVVVLGIFAIAGVGLPAWVMSQGPGNLASVKWLFWPFAISLLLLVGYIVIYLAKLTGDRSQTDH
jgi:hypothetical protein